MPKRREAHDTPTGRRLLRCDQCGRTDEVTHADLMRHTREGWPRCCGLTMAYFIEADPPAGPAHDSGRR